jgi:putative hydrolase of the HAD superfamily
VADRDSLDAVLFDAGGTLIESRPSVSEVYARVLSRWGEPVTAEQVAPAFAAVWAQLTQLHPLGLDRYHHLKGGEQKWWGEFLRRVLLRLGHNAPAEPVLTELFAEFADARLWHVFDEVPAVLTELRRRGLRMAVVSNWDSRLPTLLWDLGLRPFFDSILVSAVEGIEKPLPEIFRRATDRLGVPPTRALHVGDSPLDDYRGAQSAGLHAVLLDRAGLFSGDGYRRIANLRELHAILD